MKSIWANHRKQRTPRLRCVCILRQWRGAARVERSAGVGTRIRFLAVTAVLLMTVCSVRAGFAGFEVGNGVALTGGVVRVNYMGNKSHTISFGPNLRLRLIEVQITLANGKVKRHTMFFAGTHVLRAPLPIELTETLGPLCLLGLFCGIMMLTSRLRRAEPGAAPNIGPAAPENNAKAIEGRHR